MNTALRRWLAGATASLAVAATAAIGIEGNGGGGDKADGLPFRDTFRPGPAPGWRWVREDTKGWRVGPAGLEVRVGPGNMWGPANDATNVLVRPAPDPAVRPVEVTASVANHPTNQWEQTDLVWYYDDGNMVKVGQELVDGRLSVVMGREQKDVTRTIAILPLSSDAVHLRLRAKGNSVSGQFKVPGGEWRDAGTCELPVPAGGRPHVSLQFYRGAAGDNHWARVEELTIRLME